MTNPYRVGAEQQITSGPGGRILTNIGVWSPDSEWIVYDTRSDAEGSVFDGTRIEMVHTGTGEVRCLYEATRGACCGVASFHPLRNEVVFILGPDNPSPDWSYGPAHRQGVIVDAGSPGAIRNLDARDLTPPFTPGALRGGSHVHVYSPDGEWVSYTYNDAVLEQFPDDTTEHETDLRGVAVSVPCGPVQVPQTHSRNHDGEFFSVLTTRLTAQPAPGSDQIRKACEEGWIGRNGYRKLDGTWQHRALAFQGSVVTSGGATINEVFVVDIPDDVTVPPEGGSLEGTAKHRPLPPLGSLQRRITRTEHRSYPGLQGPRHWLRSSPDGTQIAFLMRDDEGRSQLWTVSPNRGDPRQVTRDPWNVASAFSWSPNGMWIAYAADNSVFTVDVRSGKATRRTMRSTNAEAPLPLACVFSPDGKRIAFQRRLRDGHEHGRDCHNQICIISISP